MMLKLLTHPSVDPNKRDNKGRTALEFAIKSSDSRLVRAMLQRKDTDPNLVSTSSGHTALDLVVSMCQGIGSLNACKMAEYLLSTGQVDPHAKIGHPGTSPLEIAKSLGLQELVEVMENRYIIPLER